MEALKHLKKELERINRQVGLNAATLNVLYCQKSIEEAMFWISKEIETRDREFIEELQGEE